METVKLKNGTTEAKPAVMATMLSLEHLAAKEPTAFYDLVMRCRDRDYQWFGDNQAICEKLSLMQSENRVHDTIKNIILSAAKGDGLDMSLTSPMSPNQ